MKGAFEILYSILGTGEALARLEWPSYRATRSTPVRVQRRWRIGNAFLEGVRPSAPGGNVCTVSTCPSRAGNFNASLPPH